MLTLLRFQLSRMRFVLHFKTYTQRSRLHAGRNFTTKPMHEEPLYKYNKIFYSKYKCPTCL